MTDRKEIAKLARVKSGTVANVVWTLGRNNLLPQGFPRGKYRGKDITQGTSPVISPDSSLASSSEAPQGHSEAEESPPVRGEDIIEPSESSVKVTEEASFKDVPVVLPQHPRLPQHPQAPPEHPGSSFKH